MVSTAVSKKQSRKSSKEWIDISMPLHNDMLCWPSDPFRPQIKRIWDVDKGDKNTMSEIHIISHTGTHLDAPLHFIPHSSTIDKMPLSVAIGPARVIEIKDRVSIKVEELEPYKIRKGERILFKTHNSSWIYKTDEFHKNYVYVSPPAGKYLKEIGIRLIGVDYLTLCMFETEAEYPSVAVYKATSGMHVTHRGFLENGIYILEGLNLDKVRPGRYDLICLPIRLEDGDAGLTRAVIRPR